MSTDIDNDYEGLAELTADMSMSQGDAAGVKEDMTMEDAQGKYPNLLADL